MGTPLIIGTLHPGFSRDHMMVFRRERDVRITQTAAETNRLIIRVERVKGREGTQDGVRLFTSLCPDVSSVTGPTQDLQG